MKKNSLSPLFLSFLVAGTVFVTVQCRGYRQNDRPLEKSSTPSTNTGTSDLASLTKVVLNPTQGNRASGSVVLTPMQDGKMRLTAHITDLTPGEHGFHVHEVGDCSAPDASSAGGHFNPTHSHHSGPDSRMKHAGDLGNLVANADGVVETDREYSGLSLEGNEGIRGRSLIVHALRDDFVTDPSGNSGSRVACGVIPSQGR